MNRKPVLPLALVLFAAAATEAFGHPGHPAQAAFGTGAAHPFTGWDHLLMMVGVGLWAGQRGGASLWRVPLGFLTGMLLGAVAGSRLPMFAGLETAVAATVLALGLVMVLAWRVAEPVAVIATLAAGLLHGMAHISELPAGSSPVGYASGFLLGTAALHAAGIGAALWLARSAPRPAFRWAGAAMLGAGAVLIATV